MDPCDFGDSPDNAEFTCVLRPPPPLKKKGGVVGKVNMGAMTDINFDTEDHYFFENETQTEKYEEESLVRISKRFPKLLGANEWLPSKFDVGEQTLKNVPPDGPKGIREDGKR